MLQKALAIRVSAEELGEDLEKYIGSLFLSENGVYSVAETKEEVEKNVNKRSLPLKVHIVNKEIVHPGEKIFGTAVNKALNQKIFKYIGPNKEGVDIHDFEDEEGGKVISTTTFLSGSYKHLRMASPINLKKIVSKQSLDIFAKEKN